MYIFSVISIINVSYMCFFARHILVANKLCPGTFVECSTGQWVDRQDTGQWTGVEQIRMPQSLFSRYGTKTFRKKQSNLDYSK